MEIEQLCQKELYRVQKIARLTWPDTFREILSSEQIEYMLNWMYNVEMLTKQFKEGHMFYILKDSGIDVGFIGIQPHYPTLKETKLHKIYILPSSQGKGAGLLLMKKAEEVAVKSNSNILASGSSPTLRRKPFWMGKDCPAMKVRS
jgi:GNAT superfamily N-acetyltransferase